MRLVDIRVILFRSFSINTERVATSLTFFPDSNKLLASGQHVHVSAYDCSTGKQLWPAITKGDLGPLGFKFSAALSPDSKTVLVPAGDNMSVSMCDALSGKEISQFPTGQTHYQTGIVVNPKGTMAATLSGSGTVILWKMETWKPLATLKASGINGLSFSPATSVLASAGQDGFLILWDPTTGNKFKEWQFPGPINKVLVSPDGQHLAIGNANGTVYILKLPPELAGK